MKAINNENLKNAWNEWSDDHFSHSDSILNFEEIKSNPKKVFPTKVWERMSALFPCFEGVKVLVPSSGANEAAFGFHLLGAEVTSCDISENQIKNAKKIADKQNWAINFMVLDSMDLSCIDDETYDLVYTSNGVHVWISDLSIMYSEFHRVLKGGGHYVFFETHPFNRPFNDKTNKLKIERKYGQIFKDGDSPNYLWRVQDMLNSLVDTGFSVLSMEEFFAEKDIIGAKWWNAKEWDRKADIKKNPYAALPQWISFCTTK